MLYRQLVVYLLLGTMAMLFPEQATWALYGWLFLLYLSNRHRL